MDKYKVKMIFLYSDTVEVDADDPKDAEQKALEQCQEEFETYYDCEITLV